MEKTARLSKAERESLPNSKLTWGNRKSITIILSRPQALNDYQLNILKSINNLALEYNNENNDTLGINLAAFAQHQISINHMHFYPSPAAQNNAEYFAFLMRSDQEFNHVKTITFYNNVGNLIPEL